MRSLFLTISRFASAAWVGAGVLFVANILQERMSKEIDSTTSSVLALLRFPMFYKFGFALLLVALVAGLLSSGHSAVRTWRMRVYLALLISALLVMFGDYVFIYPPLAEMTPEPVRPAEFHTYHRMSMWINALDWGLCLAAALLINWPGRGGGERVKE